MMQNRLKSLGSPRLAWYPWSRRRAMNILREAAKKEIEGSAKRKQPTQDPDVEIITYPRDPVESWRRLALRSLVVVNIAQKQVMLEELTQVTFEKASIPESVEKSIIELGLRVQQKGVGVTKAEIMLRIPLTPSKCISSAVWLDPNECQHRWLIPRGGKTYWYTCQTCPMRWPREKNEYCCDAIPPNAPVWRSASSSSR